jgi:hypothetical protein
VEIEFVQHLPIDPKGTWTKKQRKDWMHPDHGPLPDELALIDGKGNQFKVAVWLTDKHLLVALELFSEDPEEQQVPSDLRGSIMQTFRWTLNAEEGTIQCRAHSFTIPTIEDDEQWREVVIQTVMMKSVKICLETKMGESWRVGSNSETPHLNRSNDQDPSY